MSTTTEKHTEWAVHTRYTEDNFGEDEAAARAWFARWQADLKADQVWLVSRTITKATTSWAPEETKHGD